MTRGQSFRWAIADLVFWFVAPCLFLAVYVLKYPVSSNAIAPHLRIVLIAWLAVTVVRLLTARLVDREAISRKTAALIASLVLFPMLLYYITVIVGLESWGQVVSWDLIRSYALQAGALADAVGVSAASLFAAICLLFVLVYFAVSFVFKRDWTWHVARLVPAWLLSFAVVAGSIIVVSSAYSFVISGQARNDEPVSLTMFPLEAVDMLQDHAIDRFAAQRLDLLEDSARSTYVAGPYEQTNLIMIVVDALRPAHLGPYGYSRETTPTLDQLHKNGQMRVVHGVHASCAESACGLLSLATSKFVHQFSRRPISLNEVLRRHGYRIHFILGGDHTNFYGLSAAYGEVDSYFDGANAEGYYANDDKFVVDAASKLPHWDTTPTMLQFHLMSAHMLGKRHEDSQRFLPAKNYAARRLHVGSGNESFVNHYDNGVLQTDKIIGELLALLGTKGYLQKALVVITADHGESLGEHDLYAHANSVREEVLSIPLMLLAFGYEPEPLIEKRLVSQVDIAPTVLAELGMNRPATWVGIPLQDPTVRSFSYFQQKAEVGFLHYEDELGLWKYWINHRTGDRFAFDLSRDPKERSNAADSLPDALRNQWGSILIKQRHVHAYAEQME